MCWLTSIKQGDDMVVLSRGKRLHEWWSRESGCFGMLVALNLCYRSITFHKWQDLKHKEKRKICLYHSSAFQSNITIAMHVLQKLVISQKLISLCHNFKCGMCMGVLAICHILPHVIVCLVAEIFNYHSKCENIATVTVAQKTVQMFLHF